MDFIDALRNFSSRAAKVKDALVNEDAAKTALVLPFFQMLGYDIFNPTEFVPEFTADVGIKKGEKVDYAIVIDGSPVILIECKQVGDELGKHATQLFRYFTTTPAKFGILTDGIVYKFYTDLSEQNKMDLEPFLVFNVLDIPEHSVPELKRFTRKSLNIESAYIAATELKYTNKIKELLQKLRVEPMDSFVKYVMGEIYVGKQTAKAVDNFRDIVKRGFNQYISENIKDTLKNAMKSQDTPEGEMPITKEEPAPEVEVDAASMPLSQEELEAFSIVKSILREGWDISRLSCKNASNYVSVIIDGSIGKRICRFWFKGKKKSITIMGENRTPIRFEVGNLDDIYNHATAIKNALNLYLTTSIVASDEEEA